MLNFTVGPVQMDEETMHLGAESIPYFRTDEFSAVMMENERLLCGFAGAPSGSRAVFVTGSGTASMEAAVLNLFDKTDKVLVVNGGAFGARFVQLCTVLGLSYTEITLSAGQSLTEKQLSPYAGQGYTALIMQHHETSTGVLYDMNLAGKFCRENNLFLLVDCISSFLAEPLSMQAMGVDAVIIGSQKAIALPPGISAIILDSRAVSRVVSHSVRSVYFDLKRYLKDGERGQTPFTPAVQILIQLNEKLRRIEASGGAEGLIREVKERAEYFRTQTKTLGFPLVAETPSHAVTALYSGRVDAKEIFVRMKEVHGMWICPNGGELAHTVFRVGHIGSITKTDMSRLIDSLFETTEFLRKQNGGTQ